MYMPCWPVDAAISLIGLRRCHILRARAIEVSGAFVDVRGHVHEVSGSRSQRGNAVGIRQRAFRIR